jgi:hypothetical protein
MERWQTVFDPPDMQQRRFQIQHLPLQADHFGHP